MMKPTFFFISKNRILVISESDPGGHGAGHILRLSNRMLNLNSIFGPAEYGPSANRRHADCP
jgi:hypothetical protein